MTLQTQIREKIDSLKAEQVALTEVLEYLGERDCPAEKVSITVIGGSLLDFDNPSRVDVVNLLAVLHGVKWQKSVSCVEGKLNYETLEPVIGKRRLRLWAAEPPGTCKMVEERVVIPAQPAQPERVEIRKVLRCTPEAEPVPETATLTAGEAVSA